MHSSSIVFGWRRSAGWVCRLCVHVCSFMSLWIYMECVPACAAQSFAAGNCYEDPHTQTAISLWTRTLWKRPTERLDTWALRAAHHKYYRSGVFVHCMGCVRMYAAGVVALVNVETCCNKTLTAAAAAASSTATTTTTHRTASPRWRRQGRLPTKDNTCEMRATLWPECRQRRLRACEHEALYVLTIRHYTYLR